MKLGHFLLWVRTNSPFIQNLVGQILFKRVKLGQNLLARRCINLLIALNSGYKKELDSRCINLLIAWNCGKTV